MTHLMKICLVGDENEDIDKLMNKYVGRGFDSSYMMTIGAKFALKEATIDGKAIKFQVWHLAGQHGSGAVRSVYYLGALAAIVLFDVTRQESFENLQYWIKEIFNHSGKGVIPIVIGGINVDLRNSGAHPDSITDEIAIRYCEKLTEQTKDHGFEVYYFPIDVNTGQNVPELFDTLGRVYFSCLERKSSSYYSDEFEDEIEDVDEIEEEDELFQFDHFLKIRPIKALLKERIHNPISTDSIYFLRDKLESFTVEISKRALEITLDDERKTMKSDDMIEVIKELKIEYVTLKDNYRFPTAPIHNFLKLFVERVGKDSVNPLRGLLEIICVVISKELSGMLTEANEKVTILHIDEIWKIFENDYNEFVGSFYKYS